MTSRDSDIKSKGDSNEEVRKCHWMKWEGSAFPERVNHAVATDGSYMYAFGGFRGRGTVRGTTEHWNELGEVPMDVSRLDTESLLWERIYPPMGIEIPVPSWACSEGHPSSSTPYTQTEDVPPGRYAHSCACYKGRLYLYGGRNDERFFSEIECFDPETKKWSVVKATAEEDCLPAGRYAHACTCNGPLMYIQGGTLLSPSRRYLMYTSDLLSFNFESHVWKKLPVTISTDDEGDDLPLARDFHSGVYVNDMIVIFGGKCPYERDEDGFYQYILGTHEWRKIDIVGYQAPGRRSLQAVPYGEYSIIYFGGFSTSHKYFFSDVFILNTNTNHVLKLKPYGMGPCPRRRPGMCLINSDLIVCGGVGRNQDESSTHALMTYGDTYILPLLSTLEQLCIQAVIDHQLPIERLPVTIQSYINEMKSAVDNCNDAQFIKGEFINIFEYHDKYLISPTM